MAVKLRVHQNGDDVFLTWRIEAVIPDCRGFAVFRRLNGAEAEPLPSFAGFENETWTRGEHRASTEWPIQKFWWTDYTASAGDTVKYKVVPMARHGNSPDLVQLPSEASKWSTAVTISHHTSPHLACYFNRGIVATQWVQRLLGEETTVGQRRAKLDKVIVDLEKPAPRNILAGELRVGLRELLTKAAAEGRHVTAALFELSDKELVRDLEAFGPNLLLVLGNGSVKDKDDEDDNDLPTGSGTPQDENSDARGRLKLSGADVRDRMSSPRFLAHNKILVVHDSAGNPAAAWTGSTNWTPTGLCTQANNGILIEDPVVASQFHDQVLTLRDHQNDSPIDLAEANSTPLQAKVDGDSITTWFTRTRNRVDLADTIDRVNAAKDGVLFLMFKTGLSGSLLEAILKRREEPDFFVHGVISDRPTKPKPKPGEPEPPPESQIGFVHKSERVRYTPDLLLPFALTEPSEKWLQEFVKKNNAHAIVHSKVVVLDPFGAKPVVMTGSHNLGTTASKENDENLVIVSGNRPLAVAYATNVMAIYDNYRWRYRVAQGSKWKGSWDNDRWQKRYLEGQVPEFAFFTPKN